MAADPNKPNPKTHPELFADRPKRLVGIFTARRVKLDEIPRLIEFCSQAYGEDTPGASLRLKDRPADLPPNMFLIEATPGTMLKESEIVLRLHDIEDPQSDHGALIGHFVKLDPQIGEIANAVTDGAQSYLAIVGTRLLELNRIRAFLNVGALVGSALGAAWIDPAAVMATTDAGEWVEACEQSLAIEGAMASLKE